MKLRKQLPNQAVDISLWEESGEFGVYPEGAKDKILLYSPPIANINF